MQTLPADIYSVATVREIDRAAIDNEGIPGYSLMKRAAAAALSLARERFADASRWQVVCGSGNNAGDGYVLARLAASDGILVSAVAVGDPATLRGDAATAYSDFTSEGGTVVPWSGELDIDADLIIDALLGSGLTRDVEGNFAAAVTAVNEHAAKVLALDIPSGVHGDSGDVLGCAVRADATVTFVGLKAGLFLGDGPEYRGEVVFDGLAIPDTCRAASSAAFRRADDNELRRYLPRRPRNAHKGDFGHVLVIGGGPGMPGAVRLCGEAALRTGAGRVSIATDPGHAAAIVSSRPELMCHAINDAKELSQLIENSDVIAFGPGLGQSQWARGLYKAVAKDERPCVWDADALHLLAESPTVCATRIMTPHPGEAGTLLGKPAAEVQADRCAALVALEQQYGGVVVLKGAGSLTSAADGPPWLCTAGNPGMAAPGMGDVLSGIVAALLAQGLPLEAAAVIGVEVHARAGDRAAGGGERGMLASDLLLELRSIINP